MPAPIHYRSHQAPHTSTTKSEPTTEPATSDQASLGEPTRRPTPLERQATSSTTRLEPISPPLDQMPPEPLDQAQRRLIWLEIIIVMAVSFGRSGIYSILQIIDKLTQPTPLGDQTTTMNNSITPDRPWLDLAYQVYYFILPLAEAALVLLLLHLAYGMARARIGFDLARPWGDLARGFGICAAIGLPGIGFYLLARELGFNTTVAPANLSAAWWTIPVLLGSAAVAGISEEVVMLGYLLTRLRTLVLGLAPMLFFSAVIRGSYHLYQGYGGFIGNLVMGLAFGWLYLRWKRVMPLVLAHFLIDAFAFVGYALIAPYVPWL